MKGFIIIILFSWNFLHAASLSENKERRLSKLYQVIFDNHGFDYTVSGSSFEQQDFHYQLNEKKQTVYLIWSGEAAEKTSSQKSIFLTSNKEKKEIRADHFYENYSRGKLFLAVARVDLAKGDYQVKLNEKLKQEPAFSGHAMIVLKKNPSIKRLKILAGLDGFYPGSLHGIKLGENKAPLKITLIGGHGLKGNGSTNLINGVGLGSGDDWNGSSGKRWDIDSYQLNKKKRLEIGSKPLILEIDPLLQWLFPLVISVTWS